MIPTTTVNLPHHITLGSSHLGDEHRGIHRGTGDLGLSEVDVGDEG